MNVLSLVVFQTIISRQLPKSSDAKSALSDYVIFLIMLSSSGIYQSVFREGLGKRSKMPPPKWAIVCLAWVPLLWDYPLRNMKPGKGTDNRLPVARLSEVSNGSIRPLYQSDIFDHSISSLAKFENRTLIRNDFYNGRILKFIPNFFRSQKEKKKQQRMDNLKQWEELMTRFDCFIFITSLLATISIPLALFVPLIMYDDTVCPI